MQGEAEVDWIRGEARAHEPQYENKSSRLRVSRSKWLPADDEEESKEVIGGMGDDGSEEIAA